MKTPYPYECRVCGFEQDFEFNMNDKRPNKKKCPKCNGDMYRNFKLTSIKVPFQWTKDTFDFTKRDRSKRKFR